MIKTTHSVPLINEELMRAVQEHVDSAFIPSASIDEEHIDWAYAERNAHNELDKRFGHQAVKDCLAWLRS